MTATFSLAYAAFGLIAIGCGGATAIGEADGKETGGSGGAAASGSGAASTPATGGHAAGGANATGGAKATGGGKASGNAGSPATLPCEVLENAGQRCVSAHSTVRVIVPGYTGSLYQVMRDDGETKDIGAVDGYADAEAQDQFCSGAGCVIKIVYDQSPLGNDLTESPPGSAKPTPGNPVNAESLPVAIDVREVYGMLFRPGEGYRKLVGNGMARGDEPQTIYMVTSQHDLVNGCCFDYGNGSTTANDDGNGTVEAVYVGSGVIWGSGVGEGPWVMADLENGLYAGWENDQDHDISTNTPVAYDFISAVLVGDTADKNSGKGRFALYGGDATQGQLKNVYDGIRPRKPGYVPMEKRGSVILGIASDNSDGDGGRFYEGVIATGAATKETVDALQVAIVAAGYGK